MTRTLMESWRNWRVRTATRRAALRVLVTTLPARALCLIALSLLTGALPAVFAALVGRLVTEVTDRTAAASDLPPTLGLLAATLVATEIVGWGRSVLQTDVYRRFDECLMARLMERILGVPDLEPFEDPELSAKRDLAARITRFGPGELVSGLSQKWTLQAGGVAAGVLVAWSFSIPAAVILAALWFLVGAALQTSYYRANPFWSHPLRRAEYLKRLGLQPPAAKELRIFGLSRWLSARYGHEWMQVMEALWRSRRVGARWLLLLALLVTAVNASTLGAAVHAVLTGLLSVGALTVLLQGLFGMAAIASQEGDVYIENGAVPIPDLLEFEERLPAPSRAGKVATAPAVDRAIAFKDVRFGYAGRSRPVFDGLDLEIPAGRSLAIVGLNGAGKTTLVKLLCGLVQPQRGRITVDGQDLAAIEPEAWRRRIAVIFQDFVHYQLSCRENVGFGAVEAMDGPAGEQHIRASLEKAGMGSLLATLPRGLDTPLTRSYAGGVDLSGGQWQRVALARALMAVEFGARVLCLDEPTAQLDARGEADLYQRFLDLTRGLTTIVISHRFSTVRRADRIVVIERGEIVEDGHHDELVAAGGRYSRLFETQAARYREARDDG